MQPDGTPKKEDKYVSISVKPGWKSGTKVTFQKEGDQTKGKIPSDIVFLIRDKPHPLFRREGSDLRYTARLTLKQVSQIIVFFTFARFIHSSCTWHISQIVCLWMCLQRKVASKKKSRNQTESHDGDASVHVIAVICPFRNMIYLSYIKVWMDVGEFSTEGEEEKTILPLVCVDFSILPRSYRT